MVDLEKQPQYAGYKDNGKEPICMLIRLIPIYYESSDGRSVHQN